MIQEIQLKAQPMLWKKIHRLKPSTIYKSAQNMVQMNMQFGFSLSKQNTYKIEEILVSLY